MYIEQRETDEFIEYKTPAKNGPKSHDGVTIYRNKDVVEVWNDHYYSGGIIKQTKKEFLKNEWWLLHVKICFGRVHLENIKEAVENEIQKISKLPNGGRCKG